MRDRRDRLRKLEETEGRRGYQTPHTPYALPYTAPCVPFPAPAPLLLQRLASLLVWYRFPKHSAEDVERGGTGVALAHSPLSIDSSLHLRHGKRSCKQGDEETSHMKVSCRACHSGSPSPSLLRLEMVLLSCVKQG